jgi:hypothetical protein
LAEVPAARAADLAAEPCDHTASSSSWPYKDTYYVYLISAIARDLSFSEIKRGSLPITKYIFARQCLSDFENFDGHLIQEILKRGRIKGGLGGRRGSAMKYVIDVGPAARSNRLPKSHNRLSG